MDEASRDARRRELLELILRDPGVDCVICIYCSYTMPKYAAFDSSRHIPEVAGRFPDKPIACWSYGMDISGFSRAVEGRGNAMVFRSLEEAAGTLATLHDQRRMRDLAQTIVGVVLEAGFALAGENVSASSKDSCAFR